MQEKRMAKRLMEPKILNLIDARLTLTLRCVYDVKTVLMEPTIKWLLRYSRGSLGSNPDLVLQIEDYQRRRAAAISQLLNVYHIPKEVFAFHCKGIDMLGVNLRESLRDAWWNIDLTNILN